VATYIADTICEAIEKVGNESVVQVVCLIMQANFMTKIPISLKPWHTHPKQAIVLRSFPLQYITPSHKCFVHFFSRQITYFQTLFKILISYNIMDAHVRHVQLPCHE
jgi:hypothetical protein